MSSVKETRGGLPGFLGEGDDVLIMLHLKYWLVIQDILLFLRVAAT